MRAQRTGIFGGSFDPPHLGHEQIIIDSVAALRLDRIYVVPAFHSPFKERHIATPEHRRTMVNIMLKDVRDQLNMEGALLYSGELEHLELSYTWKTLEVLKERHPFDTTYLIIGDDVLTHFSRWKHWQYLLSMANLAVCSRDGNVTLPSELEDYAHVVHFFKNRPYRVSSTKLRHMLVTGTTVLECMNQNVYSYIRDNSLYATEKLDCRN